MATKPTIAGWEWEYDSATPTVDDGVAIGTWVDSKPGGGTDAVQSQGVVRMGKIGGPNQWSDDENGIIFDDLDGTPDTMTFNPANMLLSSMTLFAVVETTDLSAGCAIYGTPDGINPPVGIYLCIYPDGSIHFIIGKNGALPARDVGGGSATGLFVNGTRAYITARLDVPSGGAVIRVNGVEVASFSGIDLGSDFWFGPRLGQVNLPSQPSPPFPGAFTGVNRNMPYLGGYSTAASDAEVAAMESYLFDRFVRVFTIWTNFPNVFVPNQAKPTVDRPIVEYDVRNIKDGLPYTDGQNIRINQGGAGWKDLETSDPQGRTDAGSVGNDGNVIFVEDGWTPGIDAVRFAANPLSNPTGNGQGNYIGWSGGGAFPNPQNWSGNEYTYIGVMRCTDITQSAMLFGSNSGIAPIQGNPKKSQIWIQPDGSVAMHHSSEESIGCIQPGSQFSIQSAPGLVAPGDDVILTGTCAQAGSSRPGKTIRLNGVEVANNPCAITAYFTECSAPTLGQGQAQQTDMPSNPGTLGGLDRLIVYFAAFGSLMSTEQLEAYESYLAAAFELNLRTPWTNIPAVSPGTSWAATTP
jgi:hypothetical protein